MAKDHEFAREEVFPSWWPNKQQEFLDGFAENLLLRVASGSTTTVEVPAGTDDRVSITIEGKWRWRDTTVQRAHPGGAAGVYDVFVVTGANVLTNIPVPYTDNTDYSFDLRIVAAGATPAVVGGSTDHHRKIGEVDWSGTAITGLRQTVEEVQPHVAAHMQGGTDAIDWAGRIHGYSTLALRPVAAAAYSGLLWLVSDVNGGTLYRCRNSSGATYVWDKAAPGVTEAPQAHASAHLPSGSDALPWAVTIHGRGTLAARPVASAALEGLTYFVTDNLTLYRCWNTGGAVYAWEAIAAPGGSHAATHARGGTDPVLKVTNRERPISIPSTNNWPVTTGDVLAAWNVRLAPDEQGYIDRLDGILDSGTSLTVKIQRLIAGTWTDVVLVTAGSIVNFLNDGTPASPASLTATAQPGLVTGWYRAVVVAAVAGPKGGGITVHEIRSS